MSHDYFANIASSIGFEDAIVSVGDALHEHSSHPSVTKIKESLTGSNNFTFQTVSSDKINQKLMTIDIKKATGCDNIQGKILRLANNELTTPLTSLINNCMGMVFFLIIY